jgi:tRNA(adenine34) deaminase
VHLQNAADHREVTARREGAGNPSDPSIAPPRPSGSRARRVARRGVLLTRSTSLHPAAQRDSDDRRFMGEALRVAEHAQREGDVPVGAVVVMDGRIVGLGRNRREIDADPAGHAEIVALRQACRALGRWRVDGATLYVTLEPCPMCAGALVNARVARLVYGADDPKAGAARSLFGICDDARLNHRMDVTAGIMAEPCAEILTTFFKRARERSRTAGAR